MLPLVPTADVAADQLAAIRSLLGEAFDKQFSDEDWQHGLGGVHAVVSDRDRSVVAHGSLVERHLRHRGRELRAGYVEAVAVSGRHRRLGLGGQVMTALESRAADFDVLALSASEVAVGLYESRGWTLWRGPTSALTGDGVRRTPDDDGSVYVLPGAAPLDLDLDAELTCDWRSGDVW